MKEQGNVRFSRKDYILRLVRQGCYGESVWGRVLWWRCLRVFLLAALVVEWTSGISCLTGLPQQFPAFSRNSYLRPLSRDGENCNSSHCVASTALLCWWLLCCCSCQLDPIYCHLRGENSTRRVLPSSYWLLDNYVGHYLDKWLMWNNPIHCGWCPTPGESFFF
jgi:hypothetical protein